MVQSQAGKMMLIHELAECTGLTIDTIRFYEKQGLLDETHFERAPNGYRHYTEAGVQRLVLIKLGQAAGFTLSEMRQAIHAWETDQLSMREKEGYMLRKLEEIEAKISALNDMKHYITCKIEAMRETRKTRSDN
jgi:MerR family transcriptional regulator, copper efflux regulator